MKKLLFICTLVLFTTIMTAQVSKTINITTTGTLTTLLTPAEKITVTNLTITGNIDARDIKCMRDEMTMLEVLDMSAVSINAYTGSVGTYPSGTVFYPANEMPKYSFYDSNTDKGKSTLSTLIFPTNLTSIGEDALVACGITSLNFPEKLTKLGNASFASCTHIVNLTIPAGITSIPTTAFYNCYRINTLTLPEGLTNIGNQAFSGCSSIKTINCLAPIPPYITSIESFYNVSPSIVYVPATSVLAYKNASEWSTFKSVIMADTTSSTFIITVRSTIGGIVTGNSYQLNDGDVVNVSRTSNSTISFTFTPIPGYEIESLFYKNIDIKSQLINNHFTTPIVNDNGILTVTFKKIQYRLSIKSAESGIINWLCEYGATPSYDFIPSTGWKVNTVIYNGVDVTTSMVNGVYAVPAITDNGLLSVSFVNISSAPQLINSNVKVYTTQSNIVIEGTFDGEKISLYTTNGKQIQSVKSQGERIVIPTQRDAIYLVRIGEKVFKVIL